MQPRKYILYIVVGLKQYIPRRTISAKHLDTDLFSFDMDNTHEFEIAKELREIGDAINAKYEMRIDVNNGMAHTLFWYIMLGS
jgi:predicted GNAT family acetyltransferase